MYIVLLLKTRTAAEGREVGGRVFAPRRSVVTFSCFATAQSQTKPEPTTMSLFDAPGWESGATPVITSTSSGKKTHKRKRGSAGTDDDTGGEATSLSTSINLQKMMRKMRLSRDKRNARLKPFDHTGESPVTRKNSAIPNVVTNMDPPQTPSSMFPDSSSPRTPIVNGQPATKRPRIRREESDVLPPSSAGDETEPAHVVAEIRKKKRSKKARRTISSEPSASMVPPEANSPPGSGDRSLPTNPPTIWSVSENEDASQDGAGLTELQRKMKQKLSGGRFRYAYCIDQTWHKFMSSATE